MGINHTPGPWVIAESGQGRHFRAVNAKKHQALATVVWVMEDDDIEGVPSPECEANARLIAAAPELLEALESVLENCLDSNGLAAAYEKARAAIAKAKGEGQ